jgi:fatty-acyl-CoA synthase
MTDLPSVLVATFADIVRSRQNDDKQGLLFEDQRWSWAQVIQQCADRAAALAGLGVAAAGRPPHVGVLLDNVPEYVFWIGAAAVSGAVTVGINSSRAAAELTRDITHADVDLIITESRHVHLLADVSGKPFYNIDDRTYGGFLAPYRGAALPAESPAAETIALLLFSSGSTGAPKAVIVGQGRLGRLTPVLADRIELTRDSVTYLAMPLFHGNSVMMNLAPALATGATVAMTRKFSASGFSADIHRYRATYVNYVGRALSYVLAQPEHPLDRHGTLRLAFGTEASDTGRDPVRRAVRLPGGRGVRAQ